MDAKELRELIEMISGSNFSTFELEREGFKLKLVKGNAAPSVTPAASLPSGHGTLPPPSTEVEASSAQAAAQPSADPGIVDLKSPIVGTFYRAPNPDAPHFAEVGDQVKKGQVLCVIEAMKLMNEIEAEIDAEVTEILAVNGQPVEYGEVLFRLRPLG